MRKSVFIGVAALLAVLAEPALADDCGPLQLAATLQMQMDTAGRPLIPVLINGKPRKMLFDTGGVAAQISPALVKELDLPRRDSNLKLLDASGDVSDTMTSIDDFAVGPLDGKDVQFQISTTADPDDDGILTPSLFSRLDVDMDFGPGRFAYFTQDHCPGRVVYWKADAVAVVPISEKNLHINVPVTVDGHELRGIIDTGASGTFMDMQVAALIFGLTPKSPGMAPEGNAGGFPDLPLYGHIFSKLSFEGVTVTNAHVDIMPNRVGSRDPSNNMETGTLNRHIDDEVDHEDIIIGMNVLRKLHMFIAFKEHKLYITPAGAPDSPSPFQTAK